MLKNRKSRTVSVRDVARFGFSFLLLFAFPRKKKKEGRSFFEERRDEMPTKNQIVEIKIRGLSHQEVNYLKALAKDTKAKSFNEFLLRMCREKIEKGKFNRAEDLYVSHLENIKLTSDHVLLLTEKQSDILQDFETKMARYADHISRWLEYEGEVERDD